MPCPNLYVRARQWLHIQTYLMVACILERFETYSPDLYSVTFILPFSFYRKKNPFPVPIKSWDISVPEYPGLGGML